jgi:hypothetical protein
MPEEPTGADKAVEKTCGWSFPLLIDAMLSAGAVLRWHAQVHGLSAHVFFA